MRYTKVFYISLALIVLFTPLGCGTPVCGCIDVDYVYFDIYYKSSLSQDLLNPQTGIYDPAGVRIYEMVKQSRGVAAIPAISHDDQSSYKYVSNNGIHDGIYFVTYYCRIHQYKNDLKMTLIELKPGVTDTLTFTYTNPGKYHPDQIFYNRKLVWPPDYRFEIKSPNEDCRGNEFLS